MRRALYLLIAAATVSCVPTAARKNAKLEPGFDLDLSGGYQYVGEGESETGTTAASDGILHLEVDLQFAAKVGDDAGVAIQAKVPLNLLFSSLDVYYQFTPLSSTSFVGLGAEVGALPGVYLAATHYFNDTLYLSLTPRFLLVESRNERDLLINPQLSLGLAGAIDGSLFLSLAHHTGDGFDFDIDLFSDKDRKDYRKNFALLGLSFRL